MKYKKNKIKSYLSKNKDYWENGYFAPNVESFIFRFYGRILVNDFKIFGNKKEKLLDFGCGQGAALKYFDNLGFDVYGVDICKKDLNVAKKKLPNNKSKIRIVETKPNDKIIFFKRTKFKIVISIQTLDFLSNTDFKNAIKSIYNNMEKGGIIYASMNAWSHYYRTKHGKYLSDGLWKIKFNNGRVKYDIRYNFVKNKNEMKKKFKLFKPVYIDYYDSSFRNEGSEKRYTFLGIKE